MIGEFEGLSNKKKNTHFINVGKTKYTSFNSLKELNPLFNSESNSAQKEKKLFISKGKPEDHKAKYMCPNDDKIDGCILSWGVIDQNSEVAKNWSFVKISDKDKSKLESVDGQIYLNDSAKAQNSDK